jgi:hypothetical protein
MERVMDQRPDQVRRAAAHRLGSWRGLLACAGLGLVFAGCSAPALPEGAVPVFPVTGVLTYQGKPMSGAVITFHSRNPRLTANATANESGQYTLTTYLSQDGAAPDDYVVTIHWPQKNKKPNAHDPDPPLTPDRLGRVYADPGTTKLRAKVREQPNTIDFTLPLS